MRKKSQFSMFYLLCFESKLKKYILVKGLYIAITWTLKTLKNRLYQALKFNPSVTKKVFGGLSRLLQKCSFVNVEMIRLPINFLYIARFTDHILSSINQFFLERSWAWKNMCLWEETGIKQFTQDLISHNKEAVDTRQKPSERQNLTGEAAC